MLLLFQTSTFDENFSFTLVMVVSWDHSSHVLLHLVKSSCPNSVNPFSTLFSVDIQHNCPILFCICRPYFPPWQAFWFSIKSDYIFIFRKSDPYRHLVLNNWVFLSDLFYKMNENVKQTWRKKIEAKKAKVCTNCSTLSLSMGTACGIFFASSLSDIHQFLQGKHKIQCSMVSL